MTTILEHPEVSCAIRTGYPSWMREDDDDEILDDEDYESEFWGEEWEDCNTAAHEAYCDHLYEERRERELFGDY